MKNLKKILAWFIISNIIPCITSIIFLLKNKILFMGDNILTYYFYGWMIQIALFILILSMLGISKLTIWCFENITGYNYD